MVDFSCSFVSVCKLRKPLGGASSKLRSPHAPPKNPLRWARLAVACRTSVDEGRLTSCSPSAKARWKRLSATACPQQALCPQRGQQPVPRGRRGGARGGETAFGTPSASPPHEFPRFFKAKLFHEKPYNTLERNSFVLSSRGSPNSSFGFLSSRITPSSIKSTLSLTSLAKPIS